MTESQSRVVTIHYTLRNNDGEVLDSSIEGEPLNYLEGAHNIIPGLETALKDLDSGDRIKVTVDPEHGYGHHIADLVQKVPVDSFQGVDHIEEGMKFQVETESGPRIVTVTGVAEDVATIDANHPLAGETLNFDVEVINTRDASDDEKDQGYVLS